MAYKLKDRKEKMLYKGSVYELTLQWDRESLRKCFCGMPPFYAHIRKDGNNFAHIDCYSTGDDFSVEPMHPLFEEPEWIVHFLKSDIHSTKETAGTASYLIQGVTNLKRKRYGHTH